MSADMQKINETNKIANATLNELNAQYVALKAKSNELRKQQLRIANEKLRQQVELAKQQLIDLETRNGKKQIPVPGQKSSTTSTKTVVAAATAPNASTSESKPCAKDNKKAKKEKPTVVAASEVAATDGPVDISRLDLRIGRIIDVSKHPDADSLYVETMDLGEEKPRTIVSGLVNHYTVDEMKNRLVVVFCNLKPAKMRGVLSEGMVMCASSPVKVELIDPPANCVPGDLVHCDGYTRNPDAQLNPKKKIWESIAPDLRTNNDMIVCYKDASLRVPDKGLLKAPTQKGVNVK